MNQSINRGRRSLLSSVLAGAGAAVFGKAQAQESSATVPAQPRCIGRCKIRPQ